MKQTKLKPSRHGILVVSLCLVLGAGVSWGLAQTKFPTGAYVNGEITITFNEDGTHSVTIDNNVVVKGSYTIKEDQITLKDKEGQYACGEASPGKYRWKAEDKVLKFEKLEDECGGRADALSGQSWTKK